MISLSTALSRSSNSPRNLAPAMSAPRSSETSRLFLRLSGTSPLTMRCASPSTIAVLPTPGSPMSTGIVLRAAREHLDDAADLLVAADHGIELALARGVGEVARVALQRLVLVLGRLVGDAVRCRAPPRAPRAAPRASTPTPSSSVRRLGALRVGEREQQVLGRDVLVAELLALRPRPGRSTWLSSREIVGCASLCFG